jgi:glyoxylase-like metal-dependent hydrolase (beta-lactamase superfamily II)
VSVSYSIISIGALSRNRFWNEQERKRPAHATTTLIRDGATRILVDPGLPPEVLAHRLDERTGLRPEQIDAVFLTSFRPVHRRALALFSGASWLMHQPEIEAMRLTLADALHHNPAPDVAQLVREEQGLLQRIEAAGEHLGPQVHLFPSPGITPGSAALLLVEPSRSVVVAGDAVISREYYDAGQIYEQVADVPQAREAFKDILELADEIIPGHDNAFRVIGR